MPLVNVMVNGKAYSLGCDEGEEDHLKQLAAHVDAKVREALSMVGPSAGESKLMLMSALLMADEHYEMARKLEIGATAADDPHDARETPGPDVEQAEAAAAEMLESAARKLEDVAARLSGA
jgi:cell division protein ZapA